MPEITELTSAEFDDALPGLGNVLHACVHDGASVGFVLPFSTGEAEAFWKRKVFPAVSSGSAVLFVARDNGRIVGTVILNHDTMPNQPHRADVSKMLVHPDFRRRGIARLLLARLEEKAVDLRRSLLTLDTRTGDMAEPLYRSVGYQTTGVIPYFCTDTIDTSRLDSTTIMWKRLL